MPDKYTIVDQNLSNKNTTEFPANEDHRHYIVRLKLSVVVNLYLRYRVKGAVNLLVQSMISVVTVSVPVSVYQTEKLNLTGRVVIGYTVIMDRGRCRSWLR